MSKQRHVMYDPLKDGKPGKDFNSAYQNTEVVAHGEAVMFFNEASTDGKIPEMKCRAAMTKQALQHHDAMAKDLDRKLK